MKSLLKRESVIKNLGNNVLENLLHYFEFYPQAKAPFMHAQLAEWQQTQPLAGLKVLHHVPLVTNTLLKITCLIAAGAEVTVTNPSFLKAHTAAIDALQAANIPYIEDIDTLRHEKFDLYFDCNAELYQQLGAPNIGAIELTGSGDYFYRTQTLSFPVISIDISFTKQLETVFGCAENANIAIEQLTNADVAKKSWLIFGFGKIGRGLSYYCIKNKVAVTVVDTDHHARAAATTLGITAIDPHHQIALQNAIKQADIVVTATGKKSIFDHYSKTWFSGKILANMGVLDEYGEQFSEQEILNNKLPVNFILTDPTPMQYIDPEFYAHNIAALALLKNNLTAGVHNLSPMTDQEIISRWCQYHQIDSQEIDRWFVKN